MSTYKIIASTPEEKAQIQLRLFDAGWSWKSGNTHVQFVDGDNALSSQIVLSYPEKKMFQQTCLRNKYIEISYDSFLNDLLPNLEVSCENSRERA